jgi:hypothetical protein
MQSLRMLACVFVSLVAAASMVFSQGPAATISGTVKDQSGAVLPGASVQVTSQETGRSRAVVTDSGGKYRVPALELGTYKVQASLAGFRTTVKSDVLLTVGSEVVVDLTAEVGQVSESVSVTAEVPLVQTSSAELSGLVGDKEIRDLPLNGRSYEALAFLQPGVVQFTSASSGTTARVANGSGNKISVSGTPSDFNSFLLDGTDIHDHAGFTPGSVARNNLGVDSILEFRVFTQNYSSEYGRTAGGVISAVTRSGSNGLHGSLFEFLRNNIVDARQFFDQGGTKPFRRNQFGTAVGGPIKRDRTFFFVNYEGLRERLATTLPNTVPSADAHLGKLPSGTVPVSPLIQPYLAFYPLPNGRNFGDGTAEFLWVTNNPTREDFGSVRVDHQFSNKNYLFGRMSIDDADVGLPGNLPPFAGIVKNRNVFSTMELKTIFTPQLLNVFRVALNRTNPMLDDAFSPANENALKFVPGRKWSITTTLTSGGAGQSGTLAQMGHIDSAPQFFTQNIFQYSDDVDLHRGRHSMRMGVNLERFQNNNIQASQDGSYAFGGLLALLAAQPTQFLARTLDSSINAGFRQWLLGYYFQDDFRVTDRLTLNLGIRHEFVTNPTEVHNQQANLIDVAHDPGPTFGKVFLTNNSLKDVAPRFGFAWTPFGHGKSVIRGGIGTYFNQISGRAYYVYARSAFTKNAVIGDATHPPPFPHPGLESVSSGSISLQTWDPRPNTPTVYQYNLTVEQQLSAGVVVTAGYVGSHGSHWIRDTAPNGRVPSFLPDGTPFYTGGSRLNPAIGNVRNVTTDSVGNYNALQFQVTKRFSQRFQFQTSYTWSKSTTDATAWGSAHTLNTAPIALIIFNRHADKSLSSLNQGQVIAVNSTYRLPGNSLTGIRGVLAKGWEMSGILKASSGTPISIQVGSNRSGDSNSDAPDRPNLLPGKSNNPVLGKVDQWYDPKAFGFPAAGFYGNLGRNTVQGPGLATVDFSMVKTFAIRERQTLTLRGEFFNLLNRANFGVPNRTAFTSSGAYAGNAGVIQDLATPSRQIQFGLRYSF